MTVDVDPLVHDVWLANVMESYSNARFAVASPAVAISYVVVVTLGALAAIWQARESRETSDVFLAIATVLAALYGCYYIKFMRYGAWLALVATAIVLARLPSIGEMPARLSRIAALVFCNQLTALAVAGMALGVFASRTAPAVASDKPSFTALAATCVYKSDIRRLRHLQPGLVLSNLDLGPYIALATPHRAVAGPYHRIHPAIKRLIMALRAPLDEVERHVRDIGAEYDVLCAAPGETADTGMAGQQRCPGTCARAAACRIWKRWTDLGAMQGPLKVWRVRPAV